MLFEGLNRGECADHTGPRRNGKKILKFESEKIALRRVYCHREGVLLLGDRCIRTGSQGSKSVTVRDVR